LPLLTALLWLAWNIGALVLVGMLSFVDGRWLMRPSTVLLLSVLQAASFTALGFLPAVVVNSVLRTSDGLQARPVALGMMGLHKVEQRSRLHFGDAGVFNICSAPGLGTTVELGLPIKPGAVSPARLARPAIPPRGGVIAHDPGIARHDCR
jgi:hypothetical protein